MKFCPKCNSKLHNNTYRFCPNCGRLLADGTTLREVVKRLQTIHKLLMEQLNAYGNYHFINVPREEIEDIVTDFEAARYRLTERLYELQQQYNEKQSASEYQQNMPSKIRKLVADAVYNGNIELIEKSDKPAIELLEEYEDDVYSLLMKIKKGSERNGYCMANFDKNMNI